MLEELTGVIDVGGTTAERIDSRLLEYSFQYLPPADGVIVSTTADASKRQFPPPGSTLIFDREIEVCDQAPNSIAVGSTVGVKLRHNKADQLVVITSPEALYARYPDRKRKRRKLTNSSSDLSKFDLVALDSPYGFDGELCSQLQRHQLPLAAVRGPYITVLPDRSVVLRFAVALIPDAAVTSYKQQTLALKFLAYVLEDPTLYDPSSHTANPSDLLRIITKPRDSSMKVPDFKVEGIRASLLPYQRESVQWCLRKEGKTISENGTVEDLDPSIRDYVVSPALGWRKAGNSEIWVNPYVMRTSSTDPMPYLPPGEYQGKGLLAEEMGLGKTIEMLSLMTLHPRPSDSYALEAKVGRTYSSFYEKLVTPQQPTLKKIKTTLVIVPRTILQQWVSEVRAHAPLMRTIVLEDPHIPLSELEVIDIAFVTYNQLSRWFPYTSFQKKREARSSRYQFQEVPDTNGDARSTGTERQNTYDRRESGISSLVQVEFWRVILDEVQMVHTGDSSAALTARRIARVHAWAVSGTPVKHSLEDLRGITKFLDLHPFIERPCWQRLIASPVDLAASMRLVAMRHTKPLVADQLHIPAQHRKLLLLKFSSVERVRYNRLFSEFEEDARNSNCNLNKWLLRLRQICSHTVAQHPQMNNSSSALNNILGSAGLGSTDVVALTLDQVLTQLVDEADSEVWSEKTRKINLQLELGQLYDKDNQMPRAIDLWKNVLDEVLTQLSILAERITSVSETQSRYKSELERIGADLDQNSLESYAKSGPLSAPNMLDHDDDKQGEDINRPHHNTPDRKIYSEAEIFDAKRNLVITANRVKTLKLRHKSLQELLHKVYFFLGTGYFRSSQRMKLKLDGAEINSTHNQRIFQVNMAEETKYYELAEKIRVDLLKEAETKVLELNEVHQPLKLVNVTKYCNTPKSRIVDDLAVFAQEIIEKLQTILSQPLMDENHTEKQEELGAGVQAETDAYSKTLDLQEHAFVYLELLQVIFRDRAAAINGGNIQSSPSPEKSGDTEFVSQLIERREEIVSMLRYDHVPLTTTMKLTRTPLTIRNTLQGEIRGCQESYSVLRDLYNARVDYYKQLQDLSDQVTDLDTGEKTDYYRKIQSKKVELERVDQRIKEKLKNQTYLRNLEGSNQSMTQKRNEDRGPESQPETFSDSTSLNGVQDLNDKSPVKQSPPCTICLETIVSGAMTPCGHLFCVDCLVSWLQSRGLCPLCKRRVKLSEIHTFAVHATALKLPDERSMLEANGDERRMNASDDSHASELYLPVSHKLYNHIHRIPLPRMYGIKIDMIVRHVMFLRSQDPTAQIVIFSQWVTMLKVLCTAFAENNIVYALTSKSNLGINEFQTDSRVACLLLHAKADVAGLTLVNANHVFLCEPLMNTALELQAVSRINRIGQTRETVAWQFCVENTVEQTILGMTTKSRLLHSSANGDMAQADSYTLAEATSYQSMVDRSSGAELIGDSAALRRILFKNSSVEPNEPDTISEVSFVTNGS